MDLPHSRELRMYSGFSTVTCLVLILSAFTVQNRTVRFGEIDVERLNIIESTGQVKLVIANKERYPGPVVGGKTYERVGLKGAGIVFYNDKGDESGGLRTVSNEGGGKYTAGAGLAFDKYNGDELIGVRYNDDNGSRTVGLRILDQPDALPAEQKKNFDDARKLPLGAERDALRRQAVANQRVFVGMSADKSAAVTLLDGNSRPRIRLSVTVEGEARLEFLDVNGKVLQALPASSAAGGALNR